MKQAKPTPTPKMAPFNNPQLPLSTLFLASLFLLPNFSAGQLQVNYYSGSCPNAERIVKEKVTSLYQEHGNTAVSWLRNLFHDCMVKSCDASLLLDAANGIETEKTSPRNFGLRNFKYIQAIKEAVEKECPSTVSCADIVALSARDGIELLGGPRVDMKTGRRDSRESSAGVIEDYIPNHNDSISLVLSRFQSLGLDTEATVAILGAHSVGRVHCTNLVGRLYPEVDPSLNPDYAVYLKGRCPNPDPDPRAVEYARNDGETPMTIDNMYHKHLLQHKGLLSIDQQLASDAATLTYVQNMADDNSYFYAQFSRAIVLLSENSPLTGDQGEIRKDCRFINN